MYFFKSLILSTSGNVFLFSLVSYIYLSLGRSLRLLRKSVCKYNQISFIKKAEQSKCVASLVDPDFPYIIRALEFLEILLWYQWQSFDELQNPRYLLCLFRTERIEKLFNGTISAQSSIEDDFAHLLQVNIYDNSLQSKMVSRLERLTIEITR